MTNPVATSSVCANSHIYWLLFRKFRTTIQVKTHAQMVLRRIDSGEDVFADLDEPHEEPTIASISRPAFKSLSLNFQANKMPVKKSFHSKKMPVKKSLSMKVHSKKKTAKNREISWSFLWKTIKKSAKSAKYKCRDDRRVVLLWNRKPTSDKKFFEENTPSNLKVCHPFLKKGEFKISQKSWNIVKLFNEKWLKECK